MKLPQLKLVSHKLCPYVQRARIVLDEKAIDHDLDFIDLSNKPEWFLKISPLGKVPVLIVGEIVLFESAPIAEFLDEITPGSLHPVNALEKAENRGWIEFASDTLDTIGSFYNARDQRSFGGSVERLSQRFDAIEAKLGSGPFFNGEFFSLVDAAFGPVFRYFDVIDKYLDVGLFDKRPRLVAWRNALCTHPSVRRAVVSDYESRLRQFFLARDSILTEMVRRRDAA